MPVPTAITDLSQTAASNYPSGSDSPSTLDDVQRAHASFIAQLRDGKGNAAEVDVASASTCDIGGANSYYARITGTTAITSFGTNYNGPRFLRFAAALTLTHNASSLILPGGANITTAAGDSCVVIPIGSGTGWQVVSYQAASERPVTTTSAAASGYVRLPSGILIQWGSATSNGSGVATMSWPTAFTTACYFQSAQIVNAVALLPWVVVLGPANTTGSTALVCDSSGVGQVAVLNFVAIGK